MKLVHLLKLLPALVRLATTLFGKAKTPPKRVEDVLGGPNSPTGSAKAKAAADAAADTKYGTN